MLTLCANPRCSGEFRYLHQGEVFALESAHDGEFSPRANFAGVVQGIQYAWLCDRCVPKFEVVLDRQERISVCLRRRFSGLIAAVGLSLGLQVLSAVNAASDLGALLA